MVRLRLTCGRWDERVGDGRFVRRVRGDEFEVDESVAEWLVGSGAAVDVDGEPDVAVEPEPAVEPDAVAVEPVPAPVVEPEPGRRLPTGVERPRNAARIELWQEFAAALGVDVKGLSKREIIAKVG